MHKVDQVMRKFRLEAETLRTLRHPHICFFFDACLIRGAPAIVLELINGGTLGEYLGLDDKQDSPTGVICALRQHPSSRWESISSSQLLQLSRDVAAGLLYLHVNNVTHQDVKNSNVMVQQGRAGARAKLCDFGISRF